MLVPYACGTRTWPPYTCTMRATQDSTCAKTVFPLYWNSEWYYVLSLVKFSLKWQPNWWQLKRTPSCSRFVIQIIVVLPLLSSISCAVSVHSCNQERPAIGCNRSVYGGDKKAELSVLSRVTLSPFVIKYDDVIKWKRFPRYWPSVLEIHQSRWIPHTKASDAELWCFLWSASE